MTPENSSNFVALCVDDQLLRLILLEWISKHIEANGSLSIDDQAANAGFVKMKHLTPAEMRKIAEHAYRCVNVVISRAGLAEAVKLAAADRESSENFAFLLENGATCDMIADVMGVSDDRVLDAHARLGSRPNARGRPRMPSSEIREKMTARWHAMTELKEIERYRVLRCEFQTWTLASIAAVISEFISPPKRPASKRPNIQDSQYVLKV